MAQLFDIKVLGVKSLQKKLNRLAPAAQKKVIRKVLRASAKRGKARVLSNLSGHPVEIRSGVTYRAFRKAGIRSVARNRYEIRIGHVLPQPEDLGIVRKPGPRGQNRGHYYPMAIEFGHGNVRPYPFLRPAIDEHKQQEYTIIASELGRGIASMAAMLR